MAGLLAWAADVVAGNGNAAEQDEEDDEATRGSSLRFHFSPEQQDRVRELDSKAAVLQRTIQHLRQRIPPPDISRSLPQLHSDSLAAHSALTMELNAHEATKKEAEMREASLHAENEAYARAIDLVRQQIQNKVLEKNGYEGSLQEMENLEADLNDELIKMRNLLSEKSLSHLEVQVGNNRFYLSSGVKALEEGEELAKTRAELKSWEQKLSKLEQEWSSLLQNSARWPSVAQREKELERKLRSVSEQLMIKQTQIDSVTNERKTLARNLNDANVAYWQLLGDTGSTNLKESNVRYSIPMSGSFGPRMHSQSPHSTLKDAFRDVTNVQGYTNILRRKVGIHYRLWHAIIVAYILSLHLIVFVIISFLS